MQIEDISPETESLYCCCLEDWSDEIREAGDHKLHWYHAMKEKGLRVKIARDDNNVVAGMIQYLPIEHSMFEGHGLYVVLCIWVHGHKQGRGNFQGRGMGKALLKAAEEDCQQLGVNGIAVWGLALPFFMKASWFKRQGYKVVDRNGMMRLLWKPFIENPDPPKFMKPKKKPAKGKDAVDITIFRNGWCPAMNMSYERTLRAASEFQDKVKLTEFETLDRIIVAEWGIVDGLFIDGKEIRTGPPPSYEKIRRKISRRAAKIH
jgi:GNAT superfamily N-acetyltransferase